MRLSLRTRTLAVLAFLTLLGLAASETVSVLALRNFMVDRTDQQLDSIEPGLRHFGEEHLPAPSGYSPRPGPPGEASLDSTLPPGGYIAVLGPKGSSLFTHSHTATGQRETSPRLPSPLPALANEPGITLSAPASQVGGPEYRLHIWGLLGGRGYLVLGQSLQVVNDTVTQLALIAGVVSVAVLIGVLGLGWWLVRAGLRPLERIAATADAIAGGDLSLRAPESDPRTEVGRLAKAFNSMLAEIEQVFAQQRASEERLRRFIADASHELRTPLTSVRGYAELFRRGARARPADLAKTMARIEQEAARMGTLVDDMLLLARLDQGRPLERRPVDLSEVSMEALEAAQAVEPERPLSLQTPGPVMVEGDRRRLRQVLDNLLANVRVHTPPGAPARVEVSAHDGMALLEVADSGPGIAPRRLARVFERFYRVDEGRSRDQGGSGLGLSIVSAIARAHGGTAAARSQRGGGSTFTIRIPLETASNGSQPSGEQAG